MVNNIKIIEMINQIIKNNYPNYNYPLLVIEIIINQSSNWINNPNKYIIIISKQYYYNYNNIK